LPAAARAVCLSSAARRLPIGGGGATENPAAAAFGGVTWQEMLC